MSNAVETDADRPLRRDAARNRALILDAAAEVFAAYGIEAGYDEIARHAGVGVGTVYRRFPERDELVRALFEARMEGIVALAEQAVGHADAWAGLAWFLERALEQQAVDRGLKDVMLRTISDEDHNQFGRDRIGPLIEQLVTRAHADGALRDGVAASDVGVVLMLTGTLQTEEGPDLWRRYLAVCLDGLRAHPDHAPLPQAAPDEALMHMLMTRRPR